MNVAKSFYQNDKERLYAIIDAAVAAEDGPGGPNFTAAAVRVIDELESLAASGEAWAEKALNLCLVDGVRDMVRERTSEDRAAITVSRSGKLLSIPTRFGVRLHKRNKSNQRIYQQPLWWEVPWEVFDAIINSLAGQRDTISADITALSEVRELHKRFPDSKTPGEACRMAGIDPRQFKVN